MKGPLTCALNSAHNYDQYLQLGSWTGFVSHFCLSSKTGCGREHDAHREVWTLTVDKETCMLLNNLIIQVDLGYPFLRTNTHVFGRAI